MAALGAAILASAGLVLGTVRPASAEPRSEESQFFARANAFRVSKGLQPLSIDFELMNVARAWSARMAADDNVGHNPDLESQAINFRRVAENVGVGATVAAIEESFEQDQMQYANLVDTGFTQVGVGVVDSAGRIWVTVDFKEPGSVQDSPAVTPTPDSTITVPPKVITASRTAVLAETRSYPSSSTTPDTAGFVTAVEQALPAAGGRHPVAAIGAGGPHLKPLVATVGVGVLLAACALAIRRQAVEAGLRTLLRRL